MKRRPPDWMPWHTKPSPADSAVVRTPEEIAEIEAAREERDKKRRNELTLPSGRGVKPNSRRKMAWTNNRGCTLRGPLRIRRRLASAPCVDAAFRRIAPADHKLEVSPLGGRNEQLLIYRWGNVKMELLMESEIQSGSDTDLKAFAEKTLPVVQGHLKMAQQLQAQDKS